MRSGTYIKQKEGYRAFIPANLPPKPPVIIDQEMMRLLSDADRALGRLDGVATTLPNPDLFVAMYVRHEAVFSSQIEGTQSTLDDVLEYEISTKGQYKPKDVAEVINYVRAMNNGLARLKDFPLSLRLIKEIHADLLKGVRGGERTPGEFRTSQNWIGASGCTLQDAEFVPPPPYDMKNSLGNLEKFLHDRKSLPVLIQAALIHAQFESIHPFLDGNGRIGRLLITLMLCERDILQHPLLYLSYYLKAHRAQYYDRLMAIRNEGDWEGWIKFFLRGVSEVSQAATNTSRAILKLREAHTDILTQNTKGSPNILKLLDFIYLQPIVSIKMVKDHIGCSYVTAANLVQQFENHEILIEKTGQKRNKLYSYDTYRVLFSRQALSIQTEDESEEQSST